MIPSLRRALVLPLKWYLRRPGLAYGRTRLMTWGARILGPESHLATSTDGRRFILQFPRDRGWEPLYFTGTFETGTTELLGRILRADDVTIDVGANIGWYTTLFALRCPAGYCHAFEPEPGVFGELSANCALNRIGSRVVLNRLGVADRPGTTSVYRFPTLPHGHSSISPLVGAGGRESACRITSLDSYVEEHRITRVDLVKVDVEGAELMVLKGAARVFALKPPPMWILEVNLETSRAFGYGPRNLFESLSGRDNFRFFRVIGGWKDVLQVQDPRECVHGDNVLCVPPQRLGRIAGLQ